MSEKLELKPCPFCGSAGIPNEVANEYGYVEYHVTCASKECFADMMAYIDEGSEIAEIRWNTRSDSPELARLKRIAEFVKEHRDGFDDFYDLTYLDTLLAEQVKEKT